VQLLVGLVPEGVVVEHLRFPLEAGVERGFQKLRLVAQRRLVVERGGPPQHAGQDQHGAEHERRDRQDHLAIEPTGDVAHDELFLHVRRHLAWRWPILRSAPLPSG
jgi:hypothetical protein